MVYTAWLCYLVLSILKNLCGVFYLSVFPMLHFPCCFAECGRIRPCLFTPCGSL